MTVTLDAEAERLLQRQLEAGTFDTAEEAVEAALRQVFGQEATPELEALLDEALNHSGRRIPLGENRDHEMMKPVVLNPVAVSDLDEITDYIAADNPQAAGDVRQAFIETAEMLGSFPSLGCRPSFSAPRFADIRFIPVKRYRNYLVFYHETAEEVEILRALHAARDGRRFFRE